MFVLSMPADATLDPGALPLERLRRLTGDEYFAMAAQGWFGDEKVELIHGLVVTMSPQNDPHATLVRRISNRITRALDERYETSTQLPLPLARSHVPEPDIAVIHRIDEMRHPRTALLVIEVADSSLAYDRKIKLPIYAAAEIPEYWIIDVNRAEVQVYREPRGDLYVHAEVIGAGGRLRPAGLPTVDLSVDELFRQ